MGAPMAECGGGGERTRSLCSLHQLKKPDMGVQCMIEAFRMNSQLLGSDILRTVLSFGSQRASFLGG